MVGDPGWLAGTQVEVAGEVHVRILSPIWCKTCMASK